MAAVLDVAFDHLLHGLHQRHLYDACDVTFKGGTALRKFRIGHKGRFSFDLDFDVAEGATPLIAEEIDRLSFPDFNFTMRERRGHYLLEIESDLFPDGRYGAKMDFSERGLWLPAQRLAAVPAPLHEEYDFDARIPTPIMHLEENLSEKLGRWQRDPLVRDLYDLAALCGRSEAPGFMARLWVLKSHKNMTAAAPQRRVPGAAASLEDLIADRTVDDFALDDLVLPSNPSDAEKVAVIRGDISRVQSFCRRVARHMTPELHEIAADRGALEWQVRRKIEDLKSEAALRFQDLPSPDSGLSPLS